MVMNELISYWHPGLQSILDGFIENSIGNFPLPLGVAPNFKINGKVLAIPMAIEESSVIAAASSASKFWFDRGGFKAEVIDMKKSARFISGGEETRKSLYIFSRIFLKS